MVWHGFARRTTRDWGLGPSSQQEARAGRQLFSCLWFRPRVSRRDLVSVQQSHARFSCLCFGLRDPGSHYTHYRVFTEVITFVSLRAIARER
jgi:hypothetical protein